MANPETNKVLVVGPSWVGDMVMAQALFIDLKQQDPSIEIAVLAPSWSAALLDRMPQVDSLVAAGFEHGKLGLGERLSVARSIRDHQFDRAIVLPNSLKSALVPALARIPVRTGFVGEQRWGLLNDIRRLDKHALPMTVQRFLALGEAPGSTTRALEKIPKPSLQVSSESVNEALQKYHLTKELPILVLCPGAEFGASKKWPEPHYAETANHYLKLGWQVWLMGSEKDRDSCHHINTLTNSNCVNLAGETSLPEAIDLISCASLTVSNDSGLMHIAAALQTPLIAIYGSTDPGHTPPLSNNHRIARLNLECSPCFKRECPLHHLDCLNNLTAQLVIEYANELIN